MRYAWMRQHEDSWPLRAMCRALKVSPGGYYDWLKRPPSPRIERRNQIALALKESHAASNGVYGYRRCHRDIVEEHRIDCCRRTVQSVMHDLGLAGRAKKRFVRTTDSNHDHPVAENVLCRNFAAARPNEKWLADITYIPTNEGWLYLAAVMDVFSRRIVGWSMSDNLCLDLVMSSLSMAVEHRCPPAGLIHHSDRGSQYASSAMADKCRLHGITVSMSRRGNPWDNAMMESFFGKLKTECVTKSYANRQEAKMEVFKYIEAFYNIRRRHSSLGYVSPAEFEELYRSGASPAEKRVA